MMDLNYVNIVTNNSFSVIPQIADLLSKRDSKVNEYNLASESTGNTHIMMSVSGESEDTMPALLSHIEELSDVKEVRDMREDVKEIRFLFNVNCNCKKTLKKISKKPDRVVETNKELIYVFSC